MSRQTDETKGVVLIEPTLRAVLRGHPIVELAAELGTYLKVGCDCISLVLFLSRVSARLGWAVNVAVFTRSPTFDRLLADRIAKITPDAYVRVSTVPEMRKLASRNFDCANIVLCSTTQGWLLRYGCEATSVDCGKDGGQPCIWWICDEQSASPIIGPTLPLLENQVGRTLLGGGSPYSTPDTKLHEDAEKHLTGILRHVRPRTLPLCPFADQLRARLTLDEHLVVNRLLRTISVLRIALSKVAGAPPSPPFDQCTAEDYAVTREILGLLPVSSPGSNLSAGAVQTALILFQAVQDDDSFADELPDMREWGNKVFSRTDALEKLNLSYNTVKHHLGQLENEKIIESTRPEHQRGQGRPIYYRFRPGRSPPFTAHNPYHNLPSGKDIALHCNDNAQT